MSAAITAAVVGGGISAYGASKAGGSAKAPAPVDMFDVATKGKNKGTNLAGRQATGLLDYYGQNIPGFLELQNRLGPQLMGQMFGETGQFLGGVNGQPGFQGLQLSTSQQAGKTLEQLRAEELGQMTGQAGMTRGLMQTLSPEQTAAVSRSAQTAQEAQGLESSFLGRAGGMMGQYGSQVGQYGSTLGNISGYAGTTISGEQADQLAGGTLGGINPYTGETISGANADAARSTRMAQEAFDRRGALSPEEERASQQQAREAFSASGRLGGNAAIAAEIQNREAAKAARRGEASQLGQQAFGQQLNVAGQRLASEQALYGQRSSNVERDIALQQGVFGQEMNALQQRLASQQARYGQLGSEQERELARRQNVFSQGIGAGQQQAAERQLGFSQSMGIEQQRAMAREEAAQAGQRSYSQAGEFYTNPGLQALRTAPLSYGAGQQDLRTALTLGPEAAGGFNFNMPLNLAQQQAGAQNQSNQANYQINAANQQAKAQMWGSLGSGIGQMGQMYANSNYGGMNNSLGSVNSQGYYGGGLQLG